MKLLAINISLAILLVGGSSCQKIVDLPAQSAPLNLLASSEEKSAASTVTANYSPYYWSNLMLTNVSVDNNIYITSRDSVTWSGYNGFSNYRCETDCSGLLTALLKQTYSYTKTYLKSWTGMSNPNAAAYYNEIKTKDHFSQVSSVSNMQKGDIIAIKYPTGTSTSTGHIMLIAAAPALRTASAPLITGTTQYEVRVIDASSSGHGSLDTRYISSGNFNDGIGSGYFRLYINSSGGVAGYTWSTYSSSVYYSQSDRPLLVGRLIP